MREFRVNKFVALKLEEGKTVLYVDGKPFTQCKYLLLQIPVEHINDLDSINSIDEASESLSHILEPYEDLERVDKIDSETEFWGHCSNLQAWHENAYDTRLLYSNLAFPLLKKLTEVGDPLARKVFKEEILLRLESGNSQVISFLIIEKYIDYLEREDFLLSVLNEKDAFLILEIEKLLKIKLSAEYEDLGFCDTNAFMFDHKKVFGLQLFDLKVNSAFKYITKLEHLYFLSLNGCNLTGLPHSIENLKNLTILDLSDNKLKFIPREIKKLPELQKVNLCWNHISNIQNVVEIIENLKRLHYLKLKNNKIKILPDNLEQIKLDSNTEIEIDRNS
jgi:hypothetical protein